MRGPRILWAKELARKVAEEMSGSSEDPGSSWPILQGRDEDFDPTRYHDTSSGSAAAAAGVPFSNGLSGGEEGNGLSGGEEGYYSSSREGSPVPTRPAAAFAPSPSFWPGLGWPRGRVRRAEKPAEKPAEAKPAPPGTPSEEEVSEEVDLGYTDSCSESEPWVTPPEWHNYHADAQVMDPEEYLAPPYRLGSEGRAAREWRREERERRWAEQRERRAMRREDPKRKLPPAPPRPPLFSDYELGLEDYIRNIMDLERQKDYRVDQMRRAGHVEDMRRYFKRLFRFDITKWRCYRARPTAECRRDMRAARAARRRGGPREWHDAQTE